MRDSEDAADTKIRENQRKAKAEAEEELKERIKVGNDSNSACVLYTFENSIN